MNRREVISLLGAAAAWPLAARAQQHERMRRVGVLMYLPEDDPEAQMRLASFRQRLEELGWAVGRNLAIDYQWDAIDVDRAHLGAAQLLALAPDVILAVSTPAVQGVLSVTRSVPAVFTTVSEPVSQGFVESLARPGGNLTGFASLAPTIGGKWLDLLKEAAPRLNRVAFMFNPPTSPYGGLFFGSIQLAAAKHTMQASLLQIYDPADIDQLLANLSREPGGGLIIGGDNFNSIHHKLIVDSANRHRLPTIAMGRFYAAAGSLLAYGVDNVEHVRQAATYVDRILRGEKPSDLPVQQPTKFELIVNMKTAKALGLMVPPTLLVLANEVIE